MTVKTISSRKIAVLVKSVFAAGASALLVASLLPAATTQAQNGGPLSSPLPTPNPKATITVRVTIDPYTNIQNFRFNGDLGNFVLDTPYDGDPYTDNKTFSVNPGTYRINETLPNGWFLNGAGCYRSYYANGQTQRENTQTQAAAASGTAGVIITVAAGDRFECNFSNSQGSTIKIRKWNDKNADGQRTSNEPFLSGWQFTLLAPYGNNALVQGVTDSKGWLVLKNIRPGAYRVCEAQQSGWLNSRPTTYDYQTNNPCYLYFGVGAGQVTEVWFGNYQPGTATIKAKPVANAQVDQKPITGAQKDDAGYDGQPVVTDNQ